MNLADRRFRAGVLALLVATAACGARDDQGPIAPGLLSADAASVQLVDSPSGWRLDRYEFQAVRIVGDTLEVDVTYGGGCARHDFALLIGNAFMESYPVQVHGWLAHDAKGDPCRALVGSTLRFDLSPLRDVYRASYQTTNGVIDIGVREWPEAVRYTF